MYIPEKFPSWRYHRSEEPRLCKTPADEAALGPGWADSPAAFVDEPEPAETPAKPKKGGRK
jgi:hypothetical protein